MQCVDLQDDRVKKVFLDLAQMLKLGGQVSIKSPNNMPVHNYIQKVCGCKFSFDNKRGLV